MNNYIHTHYFIKEDNVVFFDLILLRIRERKLNLNEGMKMNNEPIEVGLESLEEKIAT